MKTIDNFLPQNSFKKLKDVLLGSSFPWYYNSKLNSFDPTEHRQIYFTHLIYDRKITSDYYTEFLDCIEKLKIGTNKLIRIKVNCYPKTNIIEEHVAHTDYKFKHRGALLSINTCNGYTGILGKKIKSKENRVLLFDPSITHFSSSCTNVGARVNINFNYE